MCRPRSQDAGVETSTIASSHEALGLLFMPRENKLARNQQRYHSDMKAVPAKTSNFFPQSSQAKISPTETFSWTHAKSVPTEHFKALTQDVTPTKAKAKAFVKINKNGKKSRPIVVVQHNYHDYSQEEERAHPFQQKSRGGVTTPFPLKLHEMLDKAMAEGYGDIVSWQPHGRCFVVYKPQDFQQIVLPKFFKLNKLSSFQRQLNLYGFQRLTFGRDRGGYYHERFLRHKEFLARGIKRVQVKGTGVRGRSNPDQEPNFWTMKWCDPTVVAKVSKTERTPVSSAIDGTNRGVLSNWNLSFSNLSQPSSQLGPRNTWSMEWCDPKFPDSSTKMGSRNFSFVGTDRGMPLTKNASFSIQGQSNSELEPCDIWSMEWCEPKFAASSSKNDCNRFDGNNHGSYEGSYCSKAEDKFPSFGDKIFDNLDPIRIFPVEENKKCASNEIPNNLYLQTFEQAI